MELSVDQRALFDSLLNDEGLLGEQVDKTIARRESRNDALLSFSQQRMWFLNQLVPESSFYNLPSVVRLTFPVDSTILQRALTEVARRHDVLRTTFVTHDGLATQHVNDETDLHLDVVEMRDIPIADREAELERLAARAAQQKFDLARGPLLRIMLVSLTPVDHALIATFHHSIADGWSLTVFYRELGELYEAFSAGRASPLVELPIQYADFAEWQRHWLSGARLDQQLSYWRERLDELPLLDLPTDHPRPTVTTFRGADLAFELPRSLTTSLRTLARTCNVTSFMVLVAGFQAILGRYARQDDVVVGIPIAGRNRTEVEPLIGFFVNTLVLRTDVGGDPSTRELLARVREGTLGALAHQDVPFEMLVDELQPGRDVSRNPLFQVTFQLFSSTQSMRGDSLLSPQPTIVRGTAIFDIAVNLIEYSDRIGGTIEYSTDLFDALTITRMADHFRALLRGMATRPNSPIGDIDLLSPAEREILVRTWNNTTQPFPENRCLHELIADQCSRHPDAPAIVADDRVLTFAELDRSANRLAHRLIASGVGPDVLVPICLPRSVNLLISMLAVLKAGGAYVPLDPTHPVDHRCAIVDSLRPTALVTSARFVDEMPLVESTFLVDELERDSLDDIDEPPDVDSQADHLAYVIYTSGSTGQPKGVMIEHRGLVNYLYWCTEAYEVASGDGAPLHGSVAFDLSVTSIFAPWLVGRPVTIVPEDTGPEGLRDHVLRADFSFVKLTPAHLAAWTPLLDSTAMDRMVRRIIVGGEQLSGLDLVHWRRFAPDTIVVNEYGPTETVVGCCVHTSRAGILTDGAVPIGRPIPNTTVYVLDDRQRLTPIGVPGEMYVGGVGVARGYIGRPDLTAERFVPDFFSPGSRLYRTGDLVRWRAVGELDYLGRIDDQIKLHGYRIEPGEVETVLRSDPRVADAVVVLREVEPGNRRLTGYVVTACPTTDPHALDTRTVESGAVAQWQHVYETLYGNHSIDGLDPTFDIVGWNDASSGLPIQSKEMRDWVDVSVERVLNASLGTRRRMLEIGCGTGLVLFRLAPFSERYVGTDFAAPVIEQVHRHLHAAGLADRVDLRHQRADDFATLEAESFDMVILNSVIQYFPSLGYMLRVLEGAIDRLAPGGSVFIGDVRNLQTLPAHHTSIQLAHASDDETTSTVWSRIHKEIAGEHELFFDPACFWKFAAQHERNIDVRIEPKRGRFRHELNCFRYDVTLRLCDADEDAVRGAFADDTTLDWSPDSTLDDLRDLLQRESSPSLLLCGMPDDRSTEAITAFDLFERDHGPSTIGELRLALNGLHATGIEPATLLELGKALGYHVEIELAVDGGPATNNVRFTLDRTHGSWRFDDWSPASIVNMATCANTPVTRPDTRPLNDELRELVARQRPSYMVPADVVVLDAFPLTSSGKIDRRALPDPEASRVAGNYVGPTTEAERILVAIWSDVLRLERIGIHDNFFSLGGDSIMSIQIVARAAKKSLHLTARQLFENQTVCELARVAGSAAIAGAEQGRVRGPVMLTPVQRWFFEQDLVDPHHYNQGLLFHVDVPLSSDRVRSAVKELMDRHDALRLRFRHDGELVQFHDDGDEIPLDEFDLTSIGIDDRHNQLERVVAEAQASLDLAHGPIWRVVLIRVDNSSRLLLVVHHLVVDAVSWGILLDDLWSILARSGTEPPAVLPGKTTSYQRWVQLLVAHADDAALEADLGYWVAQLDANAISLPTDDTGSNTVSDSDEVTVSLSRASTAALIRHVPSVYRTQINDSLLSALAVTLSDWTGRREVVVDVEGHGRDPVFEDFDVSRTVGWFTAIYPVCLSLPASSHADDALRSVKEQLRRVPKRGIGYGLLRYVNHGRAGEQLRACPHPEISFNYFGQLSGTGRSGDAVRLAAESAGPMRAAPQQRRHLIEFNAGVSDDCLEMTWTFSSRLHHRATIEHLAKSYITALDALIERCQLPDAGGVTPSDFPMARIDQQQLDRLMSSIKGEASRAHDPG